MVATLSSVITMGTALFALALPGGRETAAAPAQTPATLASEDPHEGPLGAKLLYIEQSLRCNCGCNLDVHMCQRQMQCGTSPAWTQRILDELQEGRSEDVIVAGFVSDFGQTVLMAPPMEGFNWLGYLLPSAAILTTGALIGMALRRRSSARPAPVPPGAVSDEQWDRLSAELRSIEEEELEEEW